MDIDQLTALIQQGESDNLEFKKSTAQLKAAFETYIAENEKFTGKGVKAAAARARKALQEMSKAIKERRKEITAEKEALASK